MKINSTHAARKIAPPTTPKAETDSPLDVVRDTFHRGYVSTMVALPGAFRGGLLGAGIGFANGLPLAGFHGLKPSLIAAGVRGTIGAAVGGALFHSLASLD